MVIKTHQQLKDVLDQAKSDCPLYLLLAKLDNAKNLNKNWQQLLTNIGLSNQYAKHCQIIPSYHNHLTIAVDSAAWATKLRYQNTLLMQQWRKQVNPALKRIDIIIIPPVTCEPSSTQHLPHCNITISMKNIKALKSLANHVSNEQLKFALQNLIKSATNKKN